MIVDTFGEMKHLMFMQHLHYKSLAKRKHEVLAMTLKATIRTTAEKQVHLGTRIEAARNCFRLDCLHPHFCSLHCIQLKL